MYNKAQEFGQKVYTRKRMIKGLVETVTTNTNKRKNQLGILLFIKNKKVIETIYDSEFKYKASAIIVNAHKIIILTNVYVRKIIKKN